MMAVASELAPAHVHFCYLLRSSLSMWYLGSIGLIRGWAANERPLRGGGLDTVPQVDSLIFLLMALYIGTIKN